MKRYSSLFILFLIVGQITCYSSSRKGPLHPNEDLYWHTIDMSNGLIEWTFGCNFPEEYRQLVRDSFDYWELVVDEPLFVERDDCVNYVELDYEHNNIVVLYEDVRKKSKKNEGHVVLGTASKKYDTRKVKNFTITYWKDWDKKTEGKKVSTARHEVGHVLGLNHIDSEECIMYEFITKSFHEACKTEVDRILYLYGRQQKQI